MIRLKPSVIKGVSFFCSIRFTTRRLFHPADSLHGLFGSLRVRYRPLQGAPRQQHAHPNAVCCQASRNQPAARVPSCSGHGLKNRPVFMKTGETDPDRFYRFSVNRLVNLKILKYLKILK
jgi:hypothetical protein